MRTQQRQRIALDPVTIGRELHGHGADRAQAVVDRDRARRSGEDRVGAIAVGGVEGAGCLRPVVVAGTVLPAAVAAVDQVVELGSGIAVPEVEGQAVGVDEVDLLRDRGLDVHVAGRRPVRQRADQQPVVGEAAVVVDHPVDAGTEVAAGGLGDIERAVERQVAADVDQVVERAAADVGFAELHRERGIRIEAEIAVDRQRPGAVARGDGAADHGDVAAEDAGAAERAARRDGGGAGRARLVAVDEQRAGVDAGRTAIAVGGRQDGGSRPHLADAAGAGDRVAEAVAVGTVEGERAAAEDDVVADDRTGRATVAEHQRAAVDHGVAAVGAVAGQHPGAGVVLGEDGGAVARIADRPGQRVVAGIGAAERDGAILAVAGERQRAGIGEDDRAGARRLDQGRARRQREQAVGAVAGAGVAQRRTVADHQVGRIGGRGAQAAGLPSVGQLVDAEHAAGDGGDAGVGARRVGEDPGAGTGLDERRHAGAVVGDPGGELVVVGTAAGQPQRLRAIRNGEGDRRRAGELDRTRAVGDECAVAGGAEREPAVRAAARAGIAQPAAVEDEVAHVRAGSADRTGDAAVAEACHLERSAIDGGAAGVVAVAAAQPLRVGPAHDQGTGAGDRAREIGVADAAAEGHGRPAQRDVASGRGATVQIGETRVEPVEIEQGARPSSEGHAGQPAERGARIGAQDAGAHFRAPAVAVVAGQHQGAGARLRETACTDDLAAEFQRCRRLGNADRAASIFQREAAVGRGAAAGIAQPAAVEDEIGRVAARGADAARHTPVGDAVDAELPLDRRRTGVVVLAAAERLRPSAAAGEAAGPGDPAAEAAGRPAGRDQRVAAQIDGAVAEQAADGDVEATQIERAAAVDGHERRGVAERLAGARAQDAAADDVAAGVGVGAGKHQRAVAFLHQPARADRRAADRKRRTRLRDVDPAISVRKREAAIDTDRAARVSQPAAHAQDEVARIAARGADAAGDAAIGERVHRQRAGPTGTAAGDGGGANVVVGGVRQHQRSPAGLGQAGVVRARHLPGKLDGPRGVDLDRRRTRAAVDQGETAVGGGIRTAHVVQRAAFEHEIGGVRTRGAQAARHAAVGDGIDRERAAAQRGGARVAVGADQRRQPGAALGEAGSAAVVDDGRGDGEVAGAVVLQAERGAARPSRQRAAADALVAKGGRRDEDGAVDAQRLAGADAHRRVRRRGVFQATELLAAADRAEEWRVGGPAGVADHFAGQPVRRVVLVGIVGRREGGDRTADDLRIVAAVDRRPAAEAGAVRGEAAAARQREIDETAGTGDRAQVDGHAAAGARSRGDPAAAGGDVQAVEGLAVGRAPGADDVERAAGHVQRRSGGDDVGRRRARRGEIEREPAAAQRRFARIGVRAGQGERPHSRLRQAAAAGDAAGIARAGRAVHRQGSGSERDGAAGARQARRRQVEAAKIERAAVDRDVRRRAERRRVAGAQRAAVHGDRSGARVGAGQYPGA